MKHLRKFNESNEEDIFTDESLLHDILSEYVDCGVEYRITYKAFGRWDNNDDNNFIPIGPSTLGNFNTDTNTKNYFGGTPTAHKGYQITFEELYKDGYSATDVQRGYNQKVFGKPNNNLYKFFEITKDVQYRIESMGYIFLLSTHKNAEFDFMIIENK